MFFWQMSSLKLISDMENKHQMTDISIQVTIRWLLTANYEETFLGSEFIVSHTLMMFFFHSLYRK